MMPAQHRLVDRDDLRARLENLYAKGMPVPEGSDLAEIVLRRIAESAPSGLPEIMYDLFSKLAEFPLNDSLQSFYYFVFTALDDLERGVLDAQDLLVALLDQTPNAYPEGGTQFPIMNGPYRLSMHIRSRDEGYDDRTICLFLFDAALSFEPVAPSLGDLLYLIERVLNGDPDPEFDLRLLRIE